MLGSEVSCFDAGSQPSTWDVTEEGACIHGQRPGVSANGVEWTDYTMTFSTKIVRGGTGWSVAQPLSQSGLLLLLVSDLPDETTFVNTTKTITPPNSMRLPTPHTVAKWTGQHFSGNGIQHFVPERESVFLLWPE